MTDTQDGTMKYELACTDCSFTTVVEGSIDELFDVIESHQEAVDAHHADHFVNFESLSA